MKVISTLASSQDYKDYSKTREPAVTIKPGENEVDKATLDKLKKNSLFKKHVKNGAMKVGN